MNLGAYTEALTGAEQSATTQGCAYTVQYWPTLNQFSAFAFDSYTEFNRPDSDHAFIVASVDHHGIITESRWIKEQLGLVEVAA